MSEAQTPKKPSRLRMCCVRLWRGTKWLTLAVVSLGIIYIVWTNHRGQRAAEDMIRELHDRGIPSTAVDALDEGENAARYYLAASELFTNFHPLMRQAPVLSSADWPRFGEGFTPEQSALLKAIVDENQLAFGVLRQVKPGDRTRFGLNDFPVSSQDLNLLGSMRRTARWLKLDSYQAASVGDPDRAVGDGLAMLLLSRQLNGEESMIVALVRMSIASLGQDSIESLLSRSELSDDQLDAIGLALTETGSSFDLPRILRTELASQPVYLSDPIWKHLEVERGRRAYLMKMGSYYDATTDTMATEFGWPRTSFWAGVREAVSWTYVSWCPGSVQLATADHTRQMLDFYDTLTDPQMNPQRLPQIAEKSPDCGEDTVLRRLVKIVFRVRSNMWVGQAAMQVERFRLREGRWPNDLGELYAEVPVDPYGHPLRLTTRGGELRVYSIGLNGVDDLGIQSYERDQTIDTEGKDDHAFVLLNPGQRNRPATTTLESGLEPVMDEGYQDYLEYEHQHHLP